MPSGYDLSTNRSTPVVDFVSADFDSIKRDLTTYAQATYGDRWTDFNQDQLGVIILDIVAYLGDLLGYQMNATMRELYAVTLKRRQSLITYGKPFGYEPHPPLAATVDMMCTLDPAGAYPVVIPKTTQFSNGGSGEAEVFYQPTNAITVAAYVATVSVPCTEGEYYESVLVGVSAGTPNQQWQFPQDSVVIASVTLTVGAIEWQRTDNWVLAQASSTYYKISSDDEGHAFVSFGDGMYGAIPANGAEVRATFRVGGGRRGNLPAGAIRTIVAAPAQVTAVTNATEASGGEDAQPMRTARYGVATELATLQRAVTTEDYARLALRVAGVAKARATSGLPAGARVVNIIVAPSGGGAPSQALKDAVSDYFLTRKMATNRVRLFDPIYRDVSLSVLLHVDDTHKAPAVEQLVRTGLINTNGTGLLDFAQLDFAGVDKQSAQDDVLFAQTRLQTYFRSLSTYGLVRAEIETLTVLPVARAKATGNTGNGTIAAGSIILSGKQRRREYLVQLVDAAQYCVYERIIGIVSSVTDLNLYDAGKVFEREGVTSYAGWKLQPDVRSSATCLVTTATAQAVTAAAGNTLMSLTEAGARYALYNPSPTYVNVGSQYVSGDGFVRFTLTAGAVPFIAGDRFTLDVYEQAQDLVLQEDEYPRLQSVNFLTRTSGGAKA